ncbi:hypothetical protein ACK32N_07675 [Aeromonas caviae]|uniref:hypothetical protein n=1 Tax=Aeromonas caviae TaxID=648 RepID=UPI002B49D70B|nr:hypothetical protein [Aeromonas caviae]
MALNSAGWISLGLKLFEIIWTNRKEDKPHHEYESNLPPVRDAELQIDNTKNKQA